MAATRNYTGSGVEMLLAASTLAENAAGEKQFLIEKRDAWADPYFENLQQRLADAFPRILGIDKLGDLRSITSRLQSSRTTLLGLLAELKVQIKVDYGTQSGTLLNTLGIGSSEKYKTDQEALVQTVQRLKTNLTPQLQAEFVEKGIASALIQNILTTGGQYVQAALQQETIKSANPVLTDANQQELNALYNEVIGIAKIARTFFKGQPLQQDKFSYNKILNNQSPAAKAKTSPAPAAD